MSGDNGARGDAGGEIVVQYESVVVQSVTQQSTRTDIIFHEGSSPSGIGEVDPSSFSATISSSSSSQEPISIFKLSRAQRILAGSGHVLNDLCASLWFTYLLLYMQKVVKFNDAYAAGLLLWGQVVDGVATPLVGYETDHVKNLWPCMKSYGRCKSWHLLGVILVAFSFPFIFSPCIGYSFYTAEWSQVEDWKKAVYYAPFIAIFQIGWACTQISHLALIPKLTPDDLIRTEILAVRYAFTVAANVSVFIMTWIFLSGFGTHHDRHKKCEVDIDDTSSFSFIALISVGLGSLFSLLFHGFVVEKSDQLVKRSASMLKVQESLTDIPERSICSGSANNANNNPGGAMGSVASRIPTEAEERRIRRNRTPTRLRSRGQEGASLLSSDNEDDDIVIANKNVNQNVTAKVLQPVKTFSTKDLNAGKETMGVKDWLHLPQFYTVAGLYLSTRLAVNLSQTYMPFYVEISLGLDCSAVAIIPLIMYSSGFGVSLVIKMLNKYLGRQLAYSIGTILIVIGAGLILFLDWSSPSNSWGIYAVAILLGGGASVILVTSLSITADLIGNNVESGAFVYGAMSFCDKISCGLAVVLINSLLPCKDEKNPCSDGINKVFYTDALGFSSGGSALAGLIFILIMTLMIMKKTSRPSTAVATSRTEVPT